MKKHINLVLVCVAVAALIFATVELNRLLAAAKINNDATAAVFKGNAAMKAQLDSLKPAAPQPMDTGANVSAKIAAEDKAAEERFARWRAESDAYQKREAERTENDPEYALKRYAAVRAKAEMEHAPFCRVQHLSKEQSEALAEAEFQRMLRYYDIYDMEAMQGEKYTKATLEAWEGMKYEFASNAKAALGDDLYEKFLVYDRQKSVWDCVGNLGSMLSLADIPLSVEQASQLVDTIANASPMFQKGGSAVDWDKIDWDAVDATVVDFLTPEQMNFFKNANMGVTGPSSLAGGSSRQSLELDNALRKLGAVK